MSDEIKGLLLQGYKIFLDKHYESKHTRHAYYFQENNFGCFFYHIKYVFHEDKYKPIFTDYPTIEIPLNQKKERMTFTLSSLVAEMLMYLDRGYSISCDREE